MEFGLQEEETNAGFGIGAGFLVSYAKQATVLQSELSLNIVAKNNAGTFALETTTLPISEIRRVTGGTSMESRTPEPGFSGAMTPGAQNLYLGIAVSGATGATTLGVRWDVQLVIDPA
jgi:hypothetical protein